MRDGGWQGGEKEGERDSERRGGGREGPSFLIYFSFHMEPISQSYIQVLT